MIEPKSLNIDEFCAKCKYDLYVKKNVLNADVLNSSTIEYCLHIDRKNTEEPIFCVRTSNTYSYNKIFDEPIKFEITINWDNIAEDYPDKPIMTLLYRYIELCLENKLIVNYIDYSEDEINTFLEEDSMKKYLFKNNKDLYTVKISPENLCIEENSKKITFDIYTEFDLRE